MRHSLTTLTLAGTLMTAPAYGAIINWTGDGTNNNINNSANWDGNYGSGDDLVFSDASERATVNTNASGNRDHSGSITFGGESFTVVGAGTLRHLGGDFVMDSDNTITIDVAFDMRRSLTGTGTGFLVMNNVRTQNSGYTFGGASTVVMNADRPSGFTGPNSTRVVNISDTVTVIALQGAVGGGATLNINNGATLGGSPTVTAGLDTTSVANNVTLAAGGRLSPGANGYAPVTDVGTMTFEFAHTNGRLVLNEGALFTIDLATPDTSDLIDITSGGLTLNGQQFSDFTFNALSGFGPGTYTLFQSVLTQGDLGTNLTGSVNGFDAELGRDGHNVILTVIPEPASLALVGLGSLLILGRGSRKGVTL